MKNLKKLGIITGLSLTLVACGGGDSEESDGERDSDGDVNISEEVEYTITGIEPGAGMTQQTNQLLEEYDNLAGWNHQESSTAAMLIALDDAIEKEEEIIVTGWIPHYKFAKYDLKFIEEPKEIYGGEEYITTIVRKGLKNDLPEAYEILDNIYWEPEDMGSVMLAAQDKSIEDAAQDWVNENQDTVDGWLEGIDAVDGQEIELVYTPWDSERSSAHVARLALEQKGFEVSMTQVDPQIIFQAIASGDADASLVPWMPVTHGEFYKNYEGEFEDLGPNLEGARVGLVVPSYMDIESVEELEPAE
ncbi:MULTISPECIES: glycine betaine ABC transporter substrate-binding protein [Allobacillus]|uniref:Glycine/betaine ABC transporter n=1 Tax=Allobacillus salarius TaxID=1955272 RepID=A0A556PN45_9BACI|nr:glycine betaine ABC transporter substrate-binding protein [Allobacillus salarius]TSJ65801.1 glycine/betaine ABC transporter [Allobacillus salarius]